MHKTTKRTPKGAQIVSKSLKRKTLNKEQCRSRLQSQFGSASTSLSLLSSSSSHFFLSKSLNVEPWNPLLSLPHAYLQQKRALGGLAARPGELMLHSKVTLLTQVRWCQLSFTTNFSIEKFSKMYINLPIYGYFWQDCKYFQFSFHMCSVEAFLMNLM